MTSMHLFIALLLSVLTSCANPRFVAAYPEKPNTMNTCQGTITRLDIPESGDAIIWLKLDAEHADLLRPNQTELRCEVVAARRARYETILKTLHVGKAIEASGWMVVDLHEGSIRKLRPTTSVNPYPDK